MDARSEDCGIVCSPGGPTFFLLRVYRGSGGMGMLKPPHKGAGKEDRAMLKSESVSFFSKFVEEYQAKKWSA
jgi:hypothetical protein